VEPEGIQENWKLDPFFGALPQTRFTKWRYLARWRVITPEKWKEITAWVADNLRGDFEPYENGQFGVCGVMMMDEVDFIYLKMRFHGT
jgi:hypothetical protein